MAQIRINLPLYFFNYLVECGIIDESCEYLSRGQWPKLKKTNRCKQLFI
jgi:hypothetical protein